MQVDRKIILDTAIKRMQGFSIDKDKADGSTKRSLFGVIRSILESVALNQNQRNVNLDSYRMVITRFRTFRNHRYMGVKVSDINQAINALFCDGSVILPKSEFGRFDHQDLLSYVELSRRLFMTGYALETIQGTIQIRSAPDVKTSEKIDWSFEGMRILQIQKALNEGDVSCARYVLDHINDRLNRMNFIKQAKEILDKGRV